MGNRWASPENDDTDYSKVTHIRGTITKRRNDRTFTEFWMTHPRPKGVSIDDWERIQQEKWDRIWGTRGKKQEVL